MKPLVIYHANCADGFGAAFAAWLKFGDAAEYKPCAYGARDFSHPFDIREIVDGRDVYILDFSFPRPVMDQIFTDAARVVWLDHHKTAFEMWYQDVGLYESIMDERPMSDACMWCDSMHHITLDDGKSGSYLAWEYFHPDTGVPLLIKHIDDYDRWQFKISRTKEINKALWSHTPWSFEQWKQEFLPIAMGGIRATFEQTARYSALRDEGAAILRAHNQNVQSVVKGAARKCFLNTAPISGAGLPGLAANCPPHLTSDVGHELAVQSGTFGLCWCLSQEGMTAKCSLRSNGDYDVSVIAEAFDGGGHLNSAGFEVPINTLLGWLK